MAKFRTNHEKKNNPGRFFFFRLIVFASVLIFLLIQLLKVFKRYEASIIPPTIQRNHQSPIDSLTSLTEWREVGLPTRQGQNKLVSHRYYILSYSEPDEQAEWVAYILTLAHLNRNKLKRFNYFTTDEMILSGSSTHFDYMGSGYSRGHLAPASDMSFDSIANKESFYMSNISPQVIAFNKGIWRELEENVRDWARAYQKLFIVTGPVLNSGKIKKIGKNNVTVPSLFYKVILDPGESDASGIGFIIPNAVSNRPLDDFIYSIDSVEQITGIDFFNSQTSQRVMETAEKTVKTNHWPIDKARFAERITIWNKKNK